MGNVTVRVVNGILNYNSATLIQGNSITMGWVHKRSKKWFGEKSYVRYMWINASKQRVHFSKTSQIIKVKSTFSSADIISVSPFDVT